MKTHKFVGLNGFYFSRLEIGLVNKFGAETVNFLPDDKVLHRSKVNAFADEKLLLLGNAFFLSEIYRPVKFHFYTS